MGVWEELQLVKEEVANMMGIRVEGCWRVMDKREYGLMMVACWAIWEARNMVVFEGGRAEVSDILRRVWRVMEEVEGARMDGDKGCCGRSAGVSSVVGKDVGGRDWQAPEVGWVKVNVDAGVKEGIGVGVGAVCRDDTGKVLWSLAHSRSEVWEPHVAEAVVILDGLDEAAKAGHTSVVVESDCSQVIDALRRKKTGQGIFSFVLVDILNICNSFSSIMWSFTSRANNVIAHELAHVLPAGTGKVVWYEKLPESVERLLALNQ
ncbi:uncharacterized protein LOC141595324 [Silene latifolia]|uniref:uncharacterized protein LOC141595324 n=1 Tax=Silene latifolia TaxID=37657 RepID=UPI003D76F79E